MQATIPVIEDILLLAVGTHGPMQAVEIDANIDLVPVLAMRAGMDKFPGFFSLGSAHGAREVPSSPLFT